jgi:methionyl-tRNA synthetase
MSKTVLVTSALPYVNNIPHLGNLIGSTLSGDIYARYRRLLGDKVLYLCGSDDYGTTTEVKAKQENLTCREICDKYHKIHKEVYDWFDISFDVWGQTSTETQTKITQDIFMESYKNGHIEEKETEQAYCESCKMFLADRYLQGICYHENCKAICNGDQCDTCNNFIDVDKLIELWCNMCHTKANKVKTKNLYLKLGDFTEKLKDYYLNDKKCDMSQNALSITKAWLNKGLESRCITRDLKWGTVLPVEFTEYKDKVFYVWYDAPIGYISILANARKDWKDWLQGEIVCTMAKDNINFHTIVWSATLMAASNKYPLITKILSCDYLDYQGQKFSKSKNTGIFGDTVIAISKELDINADYWRYYLIKIRPETQDSSFNWKEFIAVIKADLISNIGNLINRCFTITNKLCKGETSYEYSSIIDDVIANVNKFKTNISSNRFRDGMHNICTIANIGNKYLETEHPWTIKSDKNKVANILGTANMIIYIMLYLLQIMIPKTAINMLKHIALDSEMLPLQDIDIITKRKYMINIDTNNYKIPFKLITENDIARYL